MTHKPIHLDQFSFVLPHKTCFHEPQAILRYGQRIALIGRNGSGKSTLLRLLHEAALREMRVGFVPQLNDDEGLSGAEQFQRKLSQALTGEPQLLLLDEPTNHLDRERRQSLSRLLRSYRHTLVVATHDEELIRRDFDGYWHLTDGSLREFYGNYDDYCADRAHKRDDLLSELSAIKKDQRRAHVSLMREQARAKKSRQKGEKSIAERKWPTIVSTAKATRAEETTGRKKAALKERRTNLLERLEQLRMPEVITPQFHFSSASSTGVVLMVREGSCGYEEPLVHDINCQLRFGERLALVGNNASGKSTVMKAILSLPSVKRGGVWQAPEQHEVGYLDQNYRNLNNDLSVLQTIAERRADWTMREVRHHLSSFLFRRNEDVMLPVRHLSGGERARLSLCLIAAKSPRLLLLDEITNNVDGETREHLIQALAGYEGSMMIISHDEQFLRDIEVDAMASIVDGRFVW